MDNKPKKGHGFIYKYTGPSGKSYIGQTVQSLKDRAGHNGKNYIGCKYFYSAIKKHGWNKFTAEILGEFPVEQLNYQERKFIEVFNTLAPNGYNVLLCAHKKLIYQYDKDGRLVRSWRDLKEASEALNVPAQYLSWCVTGGQKICSGYYWSYIPLEQYPILEETNANTPTSIEQLDKDTLEVIQTFPSISAAARYFHKNGTSLIRRAINNDKYTAYGFKWRKAQSPTTIGS